MSTDLREQLNRALSGRYVVDRLIGEGGMATVYVARDVKHERNVALKVLHPELALALGAERFLAEIKTTANLHHPHILPLHDSGEAGGFLFYAMPYVDGETLRARLEREKQLPIADALTIARQTASALDYAHRHGVIHRDIKPENILLQEGAALIADFGIGLAVQSAGGPRMTHTGLSLGTPQYMSPEQAMGDRNIDARTDIYALATVVYEMLVGNPPFTGATAQAIVAKVMSERPTPPSGVRDSVPEGVERSVLKALAKLPADRFSTAADFADALDDERALTGGRASRSGGGVRRAAALAVVALVVLTGGFVAGRLRRTGGEFGEGGSALRYVVATLAANRAELYTLATRFAVSPDGERIVFRSIDSAGNGALFVRDRSHIEPQRLAGTDSEAFAPFFSPDGRWIGYVSGGAIMKIATAGGTPIQVYGSVPGGVQSGAGVAASWGADDRIMFPLSDHLMAVVSSAGRLLDTLTFKLDTIARRGEALPSGRALLAVTVGAMERIVIREPGGATRALFDAHEARATPSGHLLYTRREGATWVLMAVGFDASTAQVRGEPMTLERDVPVGFSTPAAATRNGDLVYMQGQPRTDRRIVSIDRQGNERPVTHGTRAWEIDLDLSADGTLLADEVWDGGARSIWTVNVATGAMNRVTHEFDVFGPKWTPDGKTLIVDRPTADSWIWRLKVDGTSPLEPLRTSANSFVSSVSPDGAFLFMNVWKNNAADIWQRPLSDDSAKASPVLATAAGEVHAISSPDGGWLAFASSSGGREQMHVGRRGNPTVSQQLTTESGWPLRWNRNGSRLFYRNGRDVWELAMGPGGPVAASAKRAFQVPEGIIGEVVVSPEGDRIYALRGGPMFSDLIVQQGALSPSRQK